MIESFCDDLISSLSLTSENGLEEIDKLGINGFSREEAIEKVCDNTKFEEWYFRVIEIANQY